MVVATLQINTTNTGMVKIESLNSDDDDDDDDDDDVDADDDHILIILSC